MRGYDAGWRRGYRDGDGPEWRGRWMGPRPSGWEHGPAAGPPFAPRGEYGSAYEEFGGYPGGRGEGLHYGPRSGATRGYDGFARRPFMPEEAYRRHPEYREDLRPREWEGYRRPYDSDELEDGEVRAAVYRRMRADAWVDPERIHVSVQDGIVTLSGEVDDFMEARYAWDDAWEAPGVRGVLNQLAVRSDRPHDAHGDMVVQG